MWTVPSEPDARVCFDVAVGSWSPQPSPYPIHQPPETIMLTGEIGAEKRRAFERGSHLVRPRLTFRYRESNASWRPFGGDSIRIVWTNGYMGVSISAERTPEGLEGFAESFADGIVEGESFPRAPLRGRLRSCPGELGEATSAEPHG
jgi:hypothetical protein